LEDPCASKPALDSTFVFYPEERSSTSAIEIAITIPDQIAPEFMDRALNARVTQELRNARRKKNLREKMSALFRHSQRFNSISSVMSGMHTPSSLFSL
jgi:hypothetical protein